MNPIDLQYNIYDLVKRDNTRVCIVNYIKDNLPYKIGDMIQDNRQMIKLRTIEIAHTGEVTLKGSVKSIKLINSRKDDNG